MPRPEAMSVPVRLLDPGRLEPFVGSARVAELERAAAGVRGRLGGRRVVNVNSTAVGGGVAEMLQTLLGYARGLGIRAEWLVIEGDPEFFEITKRIHNGLYGGPGDGGELGEAQRVAYERTLSANVAGIAGAVAPGDIVLVHDPQPAGLVPVLVEAGALVIWRCHVGLDGTSEWAERAWSFVRPYVEGAHGFVFSRERFAPSWVPREQLAVIPPSIDPLAPKNEPLDRTALLDVLASAGLLSRDGRAPHPTVLRRARIVRRSDRETCSSRSQRTMRGSGLHQSSGSSSPNQGKMPRAYASRSRWVERSAPAASNPFGLRNAFVTGGNASRTPNHGIMNRSATVRGCDGARVRATVRRCDGAKVLAKGSEWEGAPERDVSVRDVQTHPVSGEHRRGLAKGHRRQVARAHCRTLALSHRRTHPRTLAPSHPRTVRVPLMCRLGFSVAANIFPFATLEESVAGQPAQHPAG